MINYRRNFHTVPMHDIMHVIAQWWPTLSGLRNAEGEEAKVAAIEQFMEALMPLEDALAKCGMGKDFFGGDTIGYVDIALGSFLGRLRAIKTPGLFGWAERFVSNADAKDVIPEADKIVKFIAAELKPNKFPIHAVLLFHFHQDIRREFGMSPSQGKTLETQIESVIPESKMYMQEKEMLEALNKGKKDFDSQSIKKELHLLEYKMKAMKIENDNVMNQDLDDIWAQLIIEMGEVIRIRVVFEDDWIQCRKQLEILRDKNDINLTQL
ncbi:hypothetical protein RHSIM_RhsimUnG0179300 [Rhododendron simsii]|uniref:GST C-terminal domain-containing protein n=1 Tax=Rhododendron simsii TaxID=118357 RepID=A0A834FV47_RHOSS|nr:hypothetical protein RHSIM_RhsimUnG0179300 [Rhododendron simsii]